MKICFEGDNVFFLTPFTDGFSLSQKFRGFYGHSVNYNSPIDFYDTGLVDDSKWDCYHNDVILALPTDEATPCQINGNLIGANHGCPCAITVRSDGHGLDFSHIGKVFLDKAGKEFVLLRICNENFLFFGSKNQSKDTKKFEFTLTVTDSLILEDEGVSIPVISQQVSDLRRAIRHNYKKVVAYTDKKPLAVTANVSCDYAEILEEYYIINPATAILGVCERRKTKAFSSNPDLAEFGEPMLKVTLCYQIQQNGDVLISFEVKKLMDVLFEHCLGAMYQEKLDVYGGGIYRIIPNLKPITENGKTYDFSKPVNILKEFPHSYFVTKNDLVDGKLLDRMIDIFKDDSQKARLGFACGFLPIFDGAPRIREKQLELASLLKFTRKAYPYFASGNLGDLKGVAYKKYFIPTQTEANYTVTFDGKTYEYKQDIK